MELVVEKADLAFVKPQEVVDECLPIETAILGGREAPRGPERPLLGVEQVVEGLIPMA